MDALLSIHSRKMPDKETLVKELKEIAYQRGIPRKRIEQIH